MSITKELLEKLNEQIKNEYDSRNKYFGMESYLRGQNWDGFANFMKIQADEEMIHCRYIMEYITFIGKEFEMRALDEQTNKYKSVLDVFKKGLEHEKFVTAKIKECYNQAFEDRDYHAMKFLDWFIQEQAEEESNFEMLVARIERAKDSAGLELLDQELAQRTLVIPANPPVKLT